MGLSYYLKSRKAVYGKEYRNDLNYLYPVDVRDGVVYYEVVDEIYSLYRKWDKVVEELELIKPVSDVDLVYLDEYAGSGYWFEVREGKVRVYDVVVRLEKGRLIK